MCGRRKSRHFAMTKKQLVKVLEYSLIIDELQELEDLLHHRGPGRSQIIIWDLKARIEKMKEEEREGYVRESELEPCRN